MTSASVAAALREATAAIEAGARSSGRARTITDGEGEQLAHDLVDTLDALLLLLGTVDVHPDSQVRSGLGDAARHIFAAAQSVDPMADNDNAR